MKSRKWSARHRNAQDKICRVWEERGADYARLQRRYEEAEEARQRKARERREMEAAQVSLNLLLWSTSISPSSPFFVAFVCLAV